MNARRIAFVALGLVSLLAVCVAGAVVFVLKADLRPYVEHYAAEQLERRVTIESLGITWRDPLRLEIGGVKLANAAWGSKPDMATVEHISAVLDPRSILSGPLKFQKLEIDNLIVVLERDESGVGNWRLSNSSSSSKNDDLTRRKRQQFPTLLDFALRDSLITYRTYRGNILRIALKDVMIASGGDFQPVTLKAEGAYNDTSLRLDAITQSFEAMRDADKPFGAKFTMTTKADKKTAARVDFDGTMMQPLDFDGVDGAMTLDARNLGALLKIFGADMKADFPLVFDARLNHLADDWKLTKVAGKLAADPFNGDLHVIEGARGKPDNLDFDLAFDRLNLKPLIGDRDGKSGDPYAMSLNPIEQGGANIDAHLKAKTLSYGDKRLADVTLDGRMGDGRLDVRHFDFAFSGGRVEIVGKAGPEGGDGHATIDAALIDVDADKLAQSVGAEPGQIKGRVDGRARLDMTGRTVTDGLAKSDGFAVLAMTSGSIERALVEKASADLRTLFREKEGAARIECLFGVLVVKDGQGVLAPMKLRSSAGNFAAGGSIDLSNRHVDLTVKSERSSTGFFALDLPLRVSGSFAGLGVEPAVGADTDWLDKADGAAALDHLTTAGRRLATGSACAK